ncbi:MAG: hypothetical protein JO073_01060, partial [Actinobacteria bacterium]|nr:hypothetical protein [Actinomycetota bacterium]
ADTPVATVSRTVGATRPRLVVVSSTDEARLEGEAAELRKLARTAPLVLSGAGASEELCARLRVDRLGGNLVAAAGEVAAGARG